MQDCYVGDIGDYGKYGLLRAITAQGLTLAVNWYRVIPRAPAKQADGKFTDYLHRPTPYRACDPALFDALAQLVCVRGIREVQAVQQAELFPARFYSAPLSRHRAMWHRQGLTATEGAEVVFLDPDNGLETALMHRRGTASEKHVKWTELEDYYARGQSVVLYQHRPQMTKKEICVQNTLAVRDLLRPEGVRLLEFPRYTNRFYFMFLHRRHLPAFSSICSAMEQTWGPLGCREIPL